MTLEFPCGCEAHYDCDSQEWRVSHFCLEHGHEASRATRADDDI